MAVAEPGETSGADTFVGIAILLVIGFVVWGMGAVIDDAGRVPHNHDTPVVIRHEWLVGEYRKCMMVTTTPPVQDMKYSAAQLSELPKLYCTDDILDTVTPREDIRAHLLPVKYWGRIDRPDSWLIEWRCQRKEESLLCWART
jgi:hypothetical protein